MRATMRIGIFGGTFDPPHEGHREVARHAIRELALDHLIVIPAATPPHKIGNGVTEAHIRLEMAREGFRGIDKVLVSDIEVVREGPSYTVDTLRELRSAYPDADLFLVIGSDQGAVLHTWKDVDEIGRLATVVITRRAGEPALAGDTPIPCTFVEWDIIARSSTDIRKEIAAGAPLETLVPFGAAAIIRRENLYQR